MAVLGYIPRDAAARRHRRREVDVVSWSGGRQELALWIVRDAAGVPNVQFTRVVCSCGG